VEGEREKERERERKKTATYEKNTRPGRERERESAAKQSEWIAVHFSRYETADRIVYIARRLIARPSPLAFRAAFHTFFMR